jgi:hypothetical protein
MPQSIDRDGRVSRQVGPAMVMPRDNLIYLVIGALVVAVALLGYQLYETKNQPTGVHINLGERFVDREQVAGQMGAHPQCHDANIQQGTVDWAKAWNTQCPRAGCPYAETLPREHGAARLCSPYSCRSVPC